VGGRGLSLVAAVALGACTPDLPRHIHVDATFTADEIDLAHEAIRQANERLGVPLLGHAVLVDDGLHTDRDGFHYDDFGDDVGVIYALDSKSAEYTWLADTNDRDYQGYGTLVDVLVTVRLGPNPTDAQRAHFRQVVMHELGHYLGLPHTTDHDAVMYSGSGRLELDTYTSKDQAAFCLVYGCGG
jgi:hypothetical protein